MLWVDTNVELLLPRLLRASSQWEEMRSKVAFYMELWSANWEGSTVSLATIWPWALYLTLRFSSKLWCLTFISEHLSGGLVSALDGIPTVRPRTIYRLSDAYCTQKWQTLSPGGKIKTDWVAFHNFRSRSYHVFISLLENKVGFSKFSGCFRISTCRKKARQTKMWH